MNPALLVIDCQNDFIKGASPYSCDMLDEKLIDRIQNAISFFREKDIPVVYTQHSIKPDKSNAEFGEPEDVRACIIGTKGWEIIEELKPQKDELIIQKDKYDAFYGTNLERVLQRARIDTIILCGVLTNNCVRATAEGAHYRNFKLYVISDCCGATSYISERSAQEIHDITLTDLQERMYETRTISLQGIKDMI